MTDQDKKQPALFEKKGKELYKAGKFQQAAEEFDEAACLYLNQGNDLLAAEMRNNQSVALLQAKQPQLALEAVLGTAVLFQNTGNPLKEGMALANEATAHKELNNHQEAINKFSRAAEIFNHLNEGEMYLQTMQSISALKLKIKNIPGALFSMQEGLEGVKKPNLRQKLLKSLLKIPQNFLEK
ncbi:MAG: hypothetical protein HQ574_05685 [Chloroflexi bacterium]|nr:hypothetical protein [Chloroflexota bacterium]